MNDNIILGSIGGDIIGSSYERYSTKRIDFKLFVGSEDTRLESRFTDDTVMTVAVADWLTNGGSAPEFGTISRPSGRKCTFLRRQLA